MENIEIILSKIEKTLYDKAIEMQNPTIEQDLGTLLFFATYYNYSKKAIYKKKSLQLLEKLLDVFSDLELPTGLIEGFDGIGWVIHYLKKCEIIESEELLNDLDPYLIQSIKLNIDNNNYDLLYGSIGKIQYLIDSNRNKEPFVIELVNGIVEKLYATKIEIKGSIYWHELDNYKINLGLAHGLPSILIFLIRLKDLGYQNPLIIKMITGILKSFKVFKNKIPSISSYGVCYPVTKNLNSNSRLAWCYGDLGIAYAFLYCSRVMKNRKVESVYNEMVNLILNRGISDSGLVHFNDYSFFDTGFCHGISGISYFIYKYNELQPSPFIEDSLEYWEKELLKNIEIQLSIKEPIYYPKLRQDLNKTYTIDKEYLLNGICGVGLVLLTLKYKRADWSDIFLLY
jgi:lantibiotic biosynthesis protein